jgi:Fur family ferric uptake transcriptional regulator
MMVKAKTRTTSRSASLPAAMPRSPSPLDTRPGAKKPKRPAPPEPQKAHAGHGAHAHSAETLDTLRARLSAHMSKKGLRSTDQRRIIVDAFFAAPNHISIEELLAAVRTQDAGIGYATVYRTLKLLTECGVAFERKFGDGLTRYELADDDTHHDHLICVECGKITEFEEPRIEALQDAIAEQHGYVLRSHKLEMYGVCPDCQRV